MDAPPTNRPLRIWIGGNNRTGRRLVESKLAGHQRPPAGPLDRAVIVPESADEAAYFAGKVAARLLALGELWVVTPSRAARAGESTEPIPAPQPALDLSALGYRLVDVRAFGECSLDRARYVLRQSEPPAGAVLTD